MRRAVSRRTAVSDLCDQAVLGGDHVFCDRQEIRLVDTWMHFEETCEHANQLAAAYHSQTLSHGGSR